MMAQDSDSHQASITVRAHWSPEQALAIFEFIDELRDQLWQAYGSQIQRALREQQSTMPPTSLDIDESDVPF
jgi:hypothetical protein